MDTDSTIVIENLTKRFGRTLALDSIDLTVRQEELFALLGPNGAGKSTLIQIVCTLLKPDSGRVTVAGHDVVKAPRKARRHLGVVFQEPSLDSRLTVEENLQFHGLIFQMPRKESRTRMNDLLDLVELQDWRRTLVRNLSSGMKRRVEIVRALMHDSRVVILDEPTVGLDAQSRHKMWEYLERLRRERKLTIVVTSHYIEEVESCDRVCIIDHGKALALDTPDGLKARYGQEVMRITPVDTETGHAIAARFPNAIVDDHGDVVIAQPGAGIHEAVLHEFGTQLRRLSYDRTDLESVFLNLTGRGIRDRAERSVTSAEPKF